MARRLDPVVCKCLTVRESEVRRAIRGGADSLAAVGDACEAGRGCTSCHPAILRFLEEEVRRRLAAGEAPTALRQPSLLDFGPRQGPAPGPGGAARPPGRGQPDSAE